MDSLENGSQTEEKKRPLFTSIKTKTVNNWTKDEDKILLKRAREFNYKNWKEVASFLPGRSDIQCSARYKRIRPGIIKGTWTAEEDNNLLNLLKTFGKNWSLISKYMPSRSGKQIRDRFLNTLDPSINRDKFTKEEDMRIVEFFLKNGPAWSKISGNFYGRTGDMIKNRFYSSLKRKINKKEIVIEDGVVVDMESDHEGDVEKKEPSLKKKGAGGGGGTPLLGKKKLRERKRLEVPKINTEMRSSSKESGSASQPTDTLNLQNPFLDSTQTASAFINGLYPAINMDDQINNLIGNIVENNIRNVLKREELEYQLQVLTQLLQLTYAKLEQNKRSSSNDFNDNFISNIENSNLMQPYYNMVNSMEMRPSFMMNPLSVNGINNSIINVMNNNFCLNFRNPSEDKKS
jgi:hypothetical protein